MRVLYLEDSAADADLARRNLKRLAPEIELEVATTVAAAVARLGQDPAFDVVLSDLRLPDGSGLDLLAHVRKEGPPLPVVILTGSGDQESAIAALRAGADDYLPKGNDHIERLPRALEAARARFRAGSARRARTLRVLYGESNTLDRDLVCRHLAERAPQIQIEAVGSAAEALARLPLTPADKVPYDVILLDYELQGTDGLELAKILRDGRGLDLPVVLITGSGSEEVAAQALRLGVSDYLLKQKGHLDALPAVLERAVHQSDIAREHAALRESEARLRTAAEKLAVSERFTRETLDAMAAHVAVLDETGSILAVNGAWRRFAAANPPLASSACEGANYLAVCDSASGPGADGAAAMATGIRAILAGEQAEFGLDNRATLQPRSVGSWAG